MAQHLGEETSSHEVVVGFESKHYGGHADGHAAYQSEIARFEGERHVDAHEEQGKQDIVHRLHDVERGTAFQIVDGAASLRDYAGHGREVGVQQHEGADVLCRVRSRRHGDGAIRLFEREDVVDAVSRHRHGVSRGFECLDEGEFLVGQDASEHGVSRRRLSHFFLRGEGGHVDDVVALFQPRALGDGAHRGGIVAGDYLDVHALFAEEAQGVRSFGADLVRDVDKSLKRHFIGQFPVDEVLF